MLRDDILQAARDVSVSADAFHVLSSGDAAAVVSRMLATFVDQPKRTWWWEGFVPPGVRRPSPDPISSFLQVLVPDAAECLFLLTTPDDEVPESVFSASAATIASVIDECYRFEFVVLHPSFSWLICESHHGVLYAVGEPVRTRLESLLEP